MPAWLDQLQPASFRGVSFQVDTIEHQAGDNVVLREYPFQDLPTVFRMGEGTEEIKFSAYVIGDDYTTQRDRLREVLTGEGVLIHPTASTVRAFVNGKYSIKENPTAEGGMARFDLTFVRAEVRRYPAGVTNSGQSAKDKADAARAATVDNFASGFDITDKPGWVADRAVARVKDSVSVVWDNMGKVSGGMGDFTNAVIGNYQSVRDGVASLVRQPRLLASGVSDLLSLPADLSAASARDYAASFENLFNISPSLPRRDFETSSLPPTSTYAMYGTGDSSALGLNTPARQQLGVLNDANDQLVESLALCGWVKAIASVELTGYDDAMALRAKAHAQTMRLLLRSSTAAASSVIPTEAWHDAMVAMLSACLADIRDRSSDLVRLTTYTPDGWMPVWLVSYKLFGTADYADEILAMNPHIEHPLLVPPGKPLRVMRHD